MISYKCFSGPVELYTFCLMAAAGMSDEGEMNPPVRRLGVHFTLITGLLNRSKRGVCANPVIFLAWLILRDSLVYK